MTIEVRKNNFNGKYSIRISTTKDEKGKDIYTKYSAECTWGIIKKWCSNNNIVCPKVSALKFFSDGFGYSYAWFDNDGISIK